MKLYISADIEGTTGITRWDETENGHSRYPYFAEQMTREVAAAINGALQVSRDFELLVKDAHDSACNLIPSKLPASEAMTACSSSATTPARARTPTPSPTR